MVSIIIPAHNEESVIRRCLTVLKKGVDRGEIEVIVICNGCSDETAQLAKGMNFYLRVIETEVGSKIHALNLGDEHASYFPRIYLDADVIITYKDLKSVINVLNSGNCLAAAPRPNFITKDSSFLVACYYKVWSNVPYFKKGMLGSGFYGLTETGRRRFDRFPDIISDDGFVRLQFNESERVTVENATFQVFTPKKISGLVKIKTRAFFGNKQLIDSYPYLLENENKNNSTFFSTLMKEPKIMIFLPIYVILRFYIGLRVRRKIQDPKYSLVWERDNTSRVIE